MTVQIVSSSTDKMTNKQTIQKEKTQPSPIKLWISLKKILMRLVDESAAMLPPVEGRIHKFTVYRERWFILTAVCLLALSNATQWISYLPISKTTDAFFCGAVTEKVDYCKIGYYSNQIFQFVGMATGIMGLYITDKYGIKLSLICGCSFNALGSLIRFISTFPQVPLGPRWYLLHAGSVIAAAAQPFFLVLSPKVAEHWFPENQRSLANVLSFIANPIGVAIGSIIPNALVDQTNNDPNATEMLKLNGIFLGLATVVFLMSVFTRHSYPPTPPSASVNHNQGGFSLKTGICSIFRTPAYIVLLFPFGLSFAINWSIFVVTDNILGDLGYGDVGGYMTAIAAVSGGVSSIIAGALVDRTKAFKEVIRICFGGIVLTTLSINILLHFQGGTPLTTTLMIIFFALLGGFCIPIFPIGIELAVETTFPVAEATSSGVLVIFANASLFAVAFIMDTLATYVKPYFMEHNFQANFYVSLDFWCCLGLIGFLLSVFALKPEYKRLEFERKAVEDSSDSTCKSSLAMSTVNTPRSVNNNGHSSPIVAQA